MSKRNKRFRTRGAKRLSGSIYNRNSLDFTQLEPRQLLAADLLLAPIQPVNTTSPSTELVSESTAKKNENARYVSRTTANNKDDAGHCNDEPQSEFHPDCLTIHSLANFSYDGGFGVISLRSEAMGAQENQGKFRNQETEPNVSKIRHATSQSTETGSQPAPAANQTAAIPTHSQQDRLMERYLKPVAITSINFRNEPAAPTKSPLTIGHHNYFSNHTDKDSIHFEAAPLRVGMLDQFQTISTIDIASLEHVQSSYQPSSLETPIQITTADREVKPAFTDSFQLKKRVHQQQLKREINERGTSHSTVLRTIDSDLEFPASAAESADVQSRRTRLPNEVPPEEPEQESNSYSVIKSMIFVAIVSNNFQHLRRRESNGAAGNGPPNAAKPIDSGP